MKSEAALINKTCLPNYIIDCRVQSLLYNRSLIKHFLEKSSSLSPLTVWCRCTISLVDADPNRGPGKYCKTNKMCQFGSLVPRLPPLRVIARKGGSLGTRLPIWHFISYTSDNGQQFLSLDSIFTSRFTIRGGYRKHMY